MLLEKLGGGKITSKGLSWLPHLVLDLQKYFGLVKRMTRCNTSKKSPVIDGVSGDKNIADPWASKLKELLNSTNSSCDNFSQFINSCISLTSLSEISVTAEEVGRHLLKLKS